MEVYLCCSAEVGEEGIGLQEQHQSGTLSQLIGDCPLPPDASGLLYKVCGKDGTIVW